MRPILELSREMGTLPEFTVTQAFVLDYDRTLGDVDAAMALLYGIATNFPSFDRELLAAAQKQTEADGGSFDPLAYVRQTLSVDEFSQFEKQFMRNTAHSLLYQESKPFLKELTARKIPHCVLTYGKSRRWQELKLAASAYDGASHIIPHSDKGLELANWQTASGMFEFVGYDEKLQPRAFVKALGAVVIDDKIQSLQDLPTGVHGVYVNRENAVVDLPERCTTVRSLTGISLPTPSDLPDGITSYAPVTSRMC